MSRSPGSRLLNNHTQESSLADFEGMVSGLREVELRFHIRHPLIVQVDGTGFDETLGFSHGRREAQ